MQADKYYCLLRAVFSLNTLQALFLDTTGRTWNTHIFPCMYNWHVCVYAFCGFRWRSWLHTCSAAQAQAHSLPGLPKLAGLTVHSRQQQPGSLPHIIAVHSEAASVLGVNHSYTHPLHQRRQDQKWPIEGGRSTRSCHHKHSEVALGVRRHFTKTEFACYFVATVNYWEKD